MITVGFLQAGAVADALLAMPVAAVELRARIGARRCLDHQAESPVGAGQIWEVPVREQVAVDLVAQVVRAASPTIGPIWERATVAPSRETRGLPAPR